MFKSGFFKNVITLLSGSATAQVLMVLSYFIIARWYGPENIGEIRVYVSIVLIASLLVNGGYELAIMLPENNGNALQLVRLCGRILLATLLVTLPMAFFLRHAIAAQLNAPALEIWAVALPFSMVMEGAINLLSQFLVRNKKYKLLASGLLVYALVYSAVGLLGSWYRLSIHWLFVALVLSQLIKLAIFFFGFYRVKKGLSTEQSLAPAALARQFWQYPTYHLFSGVTNLASREMVVPMLSAFFGAATAGLFSTTLQILNLPMRFLIQAVPQVFYQRIAVAQKRGPRFVKRETLTALSFLLLVSAVPTFLLALAGPELFAYFLGEKWRASGEFIKYLAPFAVLSSVVSPITSLVNVQFKLLTFFWFNLALMCSRLGSIYIAEILTGNALTAIMWYGILAFVGALLLGLWMLKLAGVLGTSNNNYAS
ncbi:oligosaccharide flippase family protein [bacterium]|nr:oligosaccharide flippase family protein [bacterium]